MNAKRLGALAFTVAGLAFVACAARAAKLDGVDDAGVRIELARPAARVIALAPSVTELVFAAGAGDRLVGVVEGSDWPEAARLRPRVGDAQGLDVERIVALRPDLVVTWPYTTPSKVAVLRARGIAVYTIDPHSVDEIASAIERIGALAGSLPAARAAAADLRARDAALRERYRGRAPIAVFYEVWNQPLVTLGGEHLVERALETCGGRNVFAGLAGPAPSVTVEAVLAAAPEAIVAGADGGRRPAWLDEWRRWPSLPAVRLGNLESVNADLLHRPGPRFVDGVAELCAALDRARQARDAARSVR